MYTRKPWRQLVRSLPSLSLFPSVSQLIRIGRTGRCCCRQRARYAPLGRTGNSPLAPASYSRPHPYRAAALFPLAGIPHSRGPASLSLSLLAAFSGAPGGAAASSLPPEAREARQDRRPTGEGGGGDERGGRLQPDAHASAGDAATAVPISPSPSCVLASSSPPLSLRGRGSTPWPRRRRGEPTEPRTRGGRYDAADNDDPVCTRMQPEVR